MDPTSGGVEIVRKHLRAYTEQELAALPPPSYLIDGWIIEKTHSFVAALPNSGKSLLGVDWSQRLARGLDWHGRRVRRANVLYLTAEGQGAFYGRVEAWRAQEGLVGRDSTVSYVFERLTLAGTDPRQYKPDQEAVQRLVEELDIEVMWVDPLRNYVAGSLNSDEVANSYMNWVAELCHSGLTVVTHHHVAKGSPSGDGGYRIKNAGELAAGADAAFVMEPKFHEGDQQGLQHVTLQADKVKDGPYPTPMTFHTRVHEVPSGVQHLDGSPATSVALVYQGTPSVVRESSLKDRLLLEIEENPGLGSKALAGKVKRRPDDVSKVLRQLLDEGRVENLGTEKDHKYYPGNKTTE